MLRHGGSFRSRGLFVVAVVAAVCAAACNSILDFGQFSSFTGTSTGVADGGPDGATSSGGVTDGGGSDGATAEDGGCIDPTGFGGRGCWRCAATTQDQLLSVCTTSHFEVFDNNARIANFDAGDPRPALVDGGPNPPDFVPTPESGGDTQNDAGCPLDDTVNYPNPVMIYGATGFPMETIAKAMGDQATLYFIADSSCEGVGVAVASTPKMAGYATYYDKNGGDHFCRLATDFGDDPDQNPDIALSGLFAGSCSGTDVGGGTVLPAGTELPSDWKDFGGPVNPAMFAVPPTSTQKVISAEAAYRVYGFGSGSSPLAKGVFPWVDESFIFRRTQTSATQQTMARDLGLPFNALRGTNTTGSTAMREAISTVPASDIEKTIGISTSEIVDADRTSMRSLAYQHYGHSVGFYPDSDPNSFDRRNVRDGHYPLWLPLHVFSRIDGNGNAAAAPNAYLQGKTGMAKSDRDATVRKVVNVMSNRAAAPVPQIDLFGALKLLGDVPQCAMRVTRTSEGSDIIPFTPDTACGCAFEAASPGSAPADCVPCTGPEQCTGTSRTTCSFGYCE